MSEASNALDDPDGGSRKGSQSTMNMERESTPLLAPPLGQNQPDENGASLSSARFSKDKRLRFWKTAVPCALLNLVADLGGSMTNAPEVRLLEMSVCREYYRRRDPTVIGSPPFAFVDEELCKLDDIQARLAQLCSLRAMLSVIPGLLLTPLVGSWADYYGRKPSS